MRMIPYHKGTPEILLFIFACNACPSFFCPSLRNIHGHPELSLVSLDSTKGLLAGATIGCGPEVFL